MHSTVLAFIFAAVGTEVGLDPALLSAVCKIESSHRTHVINQNDGKGGHSYGVCQIKENTARFVGFTGPVAQLWYDPVTNILYAGRYLKYQLDRYDGNVKKAVGAYNTGTYKTKVDSKAVNWYYIQKVMREWKREKEKFALGESQTEGL
jgi:soluble lytic murein transglycosylase-like protein